jgi:hypothetical protein
MSCEKMSCEIINEKQIVECPICYDEIDQLKNCVTTECGHQFHCKCLMQNSATNGFACPMCRSVMAEEAEDSDDEELSEFEDYEEEEQFDDNVLTSFRMFHQQLAGEEVEEEEPVEDQEEDQDQDQEEEEIVKPSSAFIVSKLVAQGYTMEDMVNCLLVDHEEYNSDIDRWERLSDRMFGKLRQIISNYPREQEAREAAVQQRHQSSRLRVENSMGNLQNRYRILQVDNDNDNEDDV